MAIYGNRSIVNVTPMAMLGGAIMITAADTNDNQVVKFYPATDNVLELNAYIKDMLTNENLFDGIGFPVVAPVVQAPAPVVVQAPVAAPVVVQAPAPAPAPVVVPPPVVAPAPAPVVVPPPVAAPAPAPAVVQAPKGHTVKYTVQPQPEVPAEVQAEVKKTISQWMGEVVPTEANGAPCAHFAANMAMFKSQIEGTVIMQDGQYLQSAKDKIQGLCRHIMSAVAI